MSENTTTTCTTPPTHESPLPPAPADAAEWLCGWTVDSDEPTATLSRVFHGAVREAGDVDVYVLGTQYASGSVERTVVVRRGTESIEVSPDQALTLARHLVAAADEYDRLEKVHPIAREES